MYSEERKVAFLDDMKDGVEFNIEEFFEKYDHPLHAEYVELGEKQGHEGMDWLVTRGKWLDREPIVEGKYCLDKICEDKETLIY